MAFTENQFYFPQKFNLSLQSLYIPLKLASNHFRGVYKFKENSEKTERKTFLEFKLWNCANIDKTIFSGKRRDLNKENPLKIWRGKNEN